MGGEADPHGTDAVRQDVSAVWFVSVLFFVAVVWVLVPTWFHASHRPDVVELQLIGKEWVLSTTKLPMLAAWVLETIGMLTGWSFAAPFIASQICFLLTVGAVWSMGRRVLSETAARLAVVVVMPYWFFTVKSTTFNPNIVHIPLWTWTIVLVFGAMRDDRWFRWAAAGAVLGLGFYAKYTTALLAMALLVWSVATPGMRRYWRGAGPYALLLTAAIVVLPDLVWLIRHDFSCITYASSQSQPTAEWGARLVRPIEFFGGQILLILPTIVALVPVLGWKWTRRRDGDGETSTAELAGSGADSEDPTAAVARHYLAAMLLIPPAIFLTLSLVSGMRVIENYAAPLWPLLGVWLLLVFRGTFSTCQIRRAWGVMIVLEVLMLAGTIFEGVGLPYIHGSRMRVNFPAVELAAECDRIWDEQVGGKCPYMTGDWFPAGSAAFYTKDRRSVHFYWEGIAESDAVPTGAWSEDADVNRCGGLVLWQMPDGTSDTTAPLSVVPEWVHRRFPRADVVGRTVVIPWKTNADRAPLRIGIAVVRPDSSAEKNGV